MLATSKPIVTALLLGCLLLGMMLSFTGVNKTPGVVSEQALRGGAINEEASRALPAEVIVKPSQQQRTLTDLAPGAAAGAKVDEGIAAEIAEVQELTATTKENGDGTDNSALSWPEQAAESNGFWGPDNQERAQLAQFVAKGTWDRLHADHDDDSSFSFSFDL